MQNLFLAIAGMGLFYTTLTGTLYDMTVADCNSGIEMACKELQQWESNVSLEVSGYKLQI